MVRHTNKGNMYVTGKAQVCYCAPKFLLSCHLYINLYINILIGRSSAEFQPGSFPMARSEVKISESQSVIESVLTCRTILLLSCFRVVPQEPVHLWSGCTLR